MSHEILEQPKTSQEAIAAIKELFGIDVAEIKPGVVLLMLDVEGKSGLYGRVGSDQETTEDFESLMYLSQSFIDCVNAGSEILAEIVKEAHERSCPHCSQEEANDSNYDEHCTHQGSKTLQ